jgi:hypothetical protein
MLTLFWDEREVILEHYMPRRNTVYSATYADLLKKHLRPAINPNDADRCFVATWQCSAPYCPFNCCNNPRCPSSVFHIRRTRQTSPSVTCMSLDRSKRRVFQVRRKQVVHEWLCSQPKDFFSRGIHALLKHWNTCMVRNGDYIEKWSHCVPFVCNKLRDQKYLRFAFDSPTYMCNCCLLLELCHCCPQHWTYPIFNWTSPHN